MVSTKGRYALRVMIDLAQHVGEGYISLKEVAGRQNVSLKYLEFIVAQLTRGGLLSSQRGKEGGYQLARPAAEIPVNRVLALTEGSMAPVACVGREEDCQHAAGCLTLPMWQELDRLTDRYLSTVSIQDLLDGRIPSSDNIR